jgi:4-amino-4-deoxy-L-arabinose transferase-like glycosyltransferase
MFDLIAGLKKVRKLITKQDLIYLGILLFLFFITRLINLDRFPIFSDEAIYIHWAKTAWHDASWRFISLTDGKQPLQTWLTIPFLKLFPDNLLLGARLFAVCEGFVCLSGIITLLTYLFGKRTAFWGGIFYIFTPFFLFYDRLALVDSGVNAAFVWILFFSIWLVRSNRLDVALLFGFVAGIGLLAKSSVRIFLGLSVFAPILVLKSRFKKNEVAAQVMNFLFLFGISVALALLIYNVQRLSPYMDMVSEKNKTFIMTFHDFFQTPFKYFFRNLELIPWYVFQEAAFVLPLLGIIGYVVLFRDNKKLFSYLLIWIVIPFLIVCFFSIVLYPRYIIFMPTILAITAAYVTKVLKGKQKMILLLAAFFISVIYFDFSIIFHPQSIPLPPVDRAQYIEDWPAGWGVREIVEFARQKSQNKPVILLAEGNFGMASDSLESFLKRSDQGKIEVWGRWPINESDLKELQKQLKNKSVYVVFSHTTHVPDNWPLKFIQKYDKPGNTSVVLLYELLP